MLVAVNLTFGSCPWRGFERYHQAVTCLSPPGRFSSSQQILLEHLGCTRLSSSPEVIANKVDENPHLGADIPLYWVRPCGPGLLSCHRKWHLSGYMGP